MATRIVEAKWMKNQNRWQIKVQANGIRKAFTSSTPGRAGKIEANAKADEWLSTQLLDSATPVSVLWEKWLPTICSDITRTQAKTFWKNYISTIGKKAIGKLNEGDLQSVIDLAAKKGLAKKTLSLIRADMSAFIKWCRKNRYTTLTTDDVSIPKNAPVIGKKILQPDDIIKLFNCQPRMYSNVYKLGVLTGLRPGELIGLKWEDITGNELRVRRSINREDQITPGKNANAQRPIRLSKYELQVLADQKEAVKRRGIISPWVFPAQDGDHAAQKFVSRSWTALCKAEGITPGVTMYGLRHTFVSMTGDMPDGLKKRRVGHSQNMDTEGIYGKHFNGDDQLEAAYIEERISTILERTL